MNIDGLFLGAAFMLLVGSIVFLFIGDIPRRLRILAKSLLIVGASMLILDNVISYYLPGFYINGIGQVLYYVLIHLGIMTAIYGKIYLRFEDIKYKDSKWKITNNQPIYTYIATYLFIQILGYSLNIDILKEVVITENSTQSTFLGIPFVLSLITGSIVYYYNLRKNNFS